MCDGVCVFPIGVWSCGKAEEGQLGLGRLTDPDRRGEPRTMVAMMKVAELPLNTAPRHCTDSQHDARHVSVGAVVVGPNAVASAAY